MKTIILLLTILGLSACSSGGGGGAPAIPGTGLPELTAEQKGRLSTVNTDLSAINGAAGSYDKNNTSTSSINNDSFNPFDTSQRVSEKGQQLKNKLDNAITFGECTTAVSPDYSSGNIDPNNIEIEFLITDSKNSSSACPIYYRSYSKVSTSGTQANLTAQTDAENEFRAIQGSDIYQLVDVTSYKMNLSAAVTMAEQANGVSFNMSITGAGSLTSKTEGILEMEIGASGGGAFAGDPNTNQMSGSMTMAVTIAARFPDFQVVGHQQITMTMTNEGMQAEARYFVNGREVDEKEFSSVIPSDLVSTDDMTNQISAN